MKIPYASGDNSGHALAASRSSSHLRKVGGMALYTRKLKLQERKTLEAHLNAPEEDLPVHRLQIIMLSAAGKRVPEISEEVNLHPINVRKWIHRFNEQGLDGLRSGKSPGRPPVFSEE